MKLCVYAFHVLQTLCKVMRILKKQKRPVTSYWSCHVPTPTLPLLTLLGMGDAETHGSTFQRSIINNRWLGDALTCTGSR